MPNEGRRLSGAGNQKINRPQSNVEERIGRGEGLPIPINSESGCFEVNLVVLVVPDDGVVCHCSLDRKSQRPVRIIDSSAKTSHLTT
jgi:hypothetical protein